MTRVIWAASLLLLFARLANGQNASAVGDLNGLNLCSQTGTFNAACTGKWQNSDGSQVIGTTAQAMDDYGFVQSSAAVVINCSTSCSDNASAQGSASFADGATLQGVPTSGAFFLIKIAMRGVVSDPVYDLINFELQINDFQGHSSNCVIDTPTPNRNCSAYIPVSQDESIGFNVSLGNTATASLQVIGGNGTLSEGVSTTAIVTELAVVNGQGQVLKNVIITTSSGHIYPE
jgi:hypothetical protein